MIKMNIFGMEGWTSLTLELVGQLRLQPHQCVGYLAVLNDYGQFLRKELTAFSFLLQRKSEFYAYERNISNTLKMELQLL
jgi:hypothetical protein